MGGISKSILGSQMPCFLVVCSMGEAVNSQGSFRKATLKMSGSLFSSHTDGHYHVLLKLITRERERLWVVKPILPSHGQHHEFRGRSHLLLPFSIPNFAGIWYPVFFLRHRISQKEDNATSYVFKLSLVPLYYEE